MIVCICNAVKEEQIRELMEEGLTYDQACEQLGVGSDCGICLKECNGLRQLENSTLG